MTWTPERRQKQAELIRTWQPWQRSTGPQTLTGKARASRNAWKGGHRPMLRNLSKMLSDELANHRAMLEAVRC